MNWLQTIRFNTDGLDIYGHADFISDHQILIHICVTEYECCAISSKSFQLNNNYKHISPENWQEPTQKIISVEYPLLSTIFGNQKNKCPGGHRQVLDKSSANSFLIRGEFQQFGNRRF